MLPGLNKIIRLGFAVTMLLGHGVACEAQSQRRDSEKNLTKEQIEARIQALEAERAQRLALLQPAKTGQVVFGLTLPAQPDWLPKIALLLGIGAGAISLLMLPRWRKKKGEAKKVFDWERTITLLPTPDTVLRTPATVQRPLGTMGVQDASYACASGRNFGAAFPAAFDSIEYEVVQVELPGENKYLADEKLIQEGIELIEQNSTLAQARFWLELGKPAVAISILAAELDQEKKPQCWLLLLDLYAKANMRSEYEATRLRFKRIFNGKIPPFDEREVAQAAPRLKDMPELTRRINRLLPTKGIYAFLRGLLIDDRKGSRQGFEYSVYLDLVKLNEALCCGAKITRCEAICA